MTVRLRRGVHTLLGLLYASVYIVFVIPATRLSDRARRGTAASPRVLWAPIPIINIHYASRADRTQGLESSSLVYEVYSINSSDLFDRVIDLPRRSLLVRLLAPYAISIWATLKFDVFCFYFDGGLLYATPSWKLELALMRLAGKRIVVLPYGGDARLRSRTEAIVPWNLFSEVPPNISERGEADVRARLRAFDRYANVMLGCADLVEDLPRVDGVFRFPFELAGSVDTEQRVQNDVPVIVHAPNHRHFKGTHHLIRAVDELRAEGLSVELDLVEGVGNQEALRRYADADVIADQFLAGAYALFAIEGMALGKPVVSYLNGRFSKWHPEWEECPIVSANPEELKDALRRLVTDRELREELGERGPAYVAKYHSLASVGRSMKPFYLGSSA